MSFAANPNKKQKTTVDSEAAAALRQQKQDRERIRRLIITLGDEKKKVLGQIRGLVGALEDDVELHGEVMADTILECAKCLPLKSTIFAALVTRMVQKHSAWVCGLVHKALVDLRAAVRAGKVVEAQLLLRFFTCLGNSGLLALPRVLRLLKEVVSLSEGLKPSKGGDLGVFLALATLTFLSPAAYAKAPSEVAFILESAGTYLVSREARWKSLLRLLKSEDPPDRLESLAVALQALTKADWTSEAVLHVPGLEPSVEGHSEMPKELLLEVTAEEVRKGKVRMQVPLMACRVVTGRATDCEAGIQMPEQDRWVLEDYILTTLDMFGRDIEECSRQMLRIPILHPKFEIIVVETIFSQMLRLPSPSFLPVFYSRLLETLVTMQGTIAQVVDKVFVSYVKRLSDLDEDCFDVLAEAFAYHLVHANYKTDWEVFTGDDANVHVQRFARRMLERLQRLSFHQNLLHRLPEAMHVYVPPEPLAATDLPVLTIPEFKSLTGIAKIKEPDEKKVFRFCRKLMHVHTKQELKDEEVEKAAAARPPEAKDRPDICKVEEESKPDSLMTEAQAVEHVRKQKEEGGSESGQHPDTPAAKRSRQDGGAIVDVVPEKEKEADAVVVETALLESKPVLAKASAEKLNQENADSTPPQATTETQSKVEAGDTPGRVKEEVKHEDGATIAATPTPISEAEGAAKASTAAGVDMEKETPPWPFDSVVELLCMVVLHNGAKTPTHMSKMLDGYQQVFSKLRPDDEEPAHRFAKTIVRCAFEFWRVSGQRLEITLEALLHRSIVTPRAVIEQALADRGPLGCDSLSIWNLIHSVARKALERSQIARAELAIAKKLEKAEAIERCKGQLDTAIQDTADLFSMIFTGLVRNHQDFEDSDNRFRHITLQRVLTIGRKYHGFIKPLIDSASSRIPGVAHNPDIATIFQSLSTL